ncbi:MAG TPA: hypothetical protein VN921_04290 [Chthoniobacterales bacterium]|nr:hypothetical protein [Chthoniobacterales bacterium]
MSKAHATLSPRTNILLILAWGTATVIFLLVIQPRLPLALAVAGAVLGGVGGVMQHLSFIQARASFAAASSLMEVRRALKATMWGGHYIYWLYFSKIVLVALAFWLVRSPLLNVIFGYLTGYAALMFVRELITLRDAFSLSHFDTHGSDTNAA